MVGRALTAVFAAVVLWVGPSMITAILKSIGTRAYASYPAEMFQAGRSVYSTAVESLDPVLPPLLVAAAMAAIGILVRTRTSCRCAARRRNELKALLVGVQAAEQPGSNSASSRRVRHHSLSVAALSSDEVVETEAWR